MHEPSADSGAVERNGDTLPLMLSALPDPETRLRREFGWWHRQRDHYSQAFAMDALREWMLALRYIQLKEIPYDLRATLRLMRRDIPEVLDAVCSEVYRILYAPKPEVRTPEPPATTTRPRPIPPEGLIESPIHDAVTMADEIDGFYA